LSWYRLLLGRGDLKLCSVMDLSSGCCGLRLNRWLRWMPMLQSIRWSFLLLVHNQCEEKACVLSLSLGGCNGRFGSNCSTSVAVQFGVSPLERGRGSVHMASTLCTWRVLRVPRQYIGTQTGLLGPGGVTACEYSGRPPNTNSHQPSLRPEQHTARSELLSRTNQESRLGSPRGKRIRNNHLSAGLPPRGSPSLK
jgi:hypothetical protein